MAIKTYSSKGKKLYEVYVNGFDARGKRIQMRKRGIESIKKAKDLEFEFERDLAKIKEGSVHERWGEWLEECLKIMKVNYRPSTVYNYEKSARRWIQKPWEDKELRKITNMDVHELIFELIPAEVTMHTRKYVLKIVKRIFQMAVDNGKMDRNPALGLMVKVPETPKKVLTNSDAETFLSQAKLTNHRFYPIWALALFTGCRSGELYALKWSDVDMEARTISISRSWNSKNGFTSTKNQKSRMVPISDELMVFLKQLRLQRGKEEFVLPHLQEWTRGCAAKVTRSFCKAIGVTDIKFHDLRATFITNLLARGVPLAVVMAIVGHADMETTNVYLRQAGVEIQGGTDKLGYKLPGDQAAQILQLVR
ncbi:MAG: site-specific integrase [Bdellovibrionaceae bacterium]|nr:site-specific integrase [Pseudobdellovibrionaceae bacterium]